MNKFLKIILSFLIILAVIITNNKIILWVFLLLLTIYNFYKNNKLLILADIILVAFLALSLNYDFALFLFKIGYIITFLYTLYLSYFSVYKGVVKVRRKKLQILFNEENFDNIVNKINNKKDEYYEEDVNVNEEIERDLNRKYLQSRIRFYGFNKITTYKKKNNSWLVIDTLILLFAIIIFIIILLIG